MPGGAWDPSGGVPNPPPDYPFHFFSFLWSVQFVFIYLFLHSRQLSCVPPPFKPCRRSAADPPSPRQEAFRNFLIPAAFRSALLSASFWAREPGHPAGGAAFCSPAAAVTEGRCCHAGLMLKTPPRLPTKPISPRFFSVEERCWATLTHLTMPLTFQVVFFF